jgi:hypothetical protein
VVRLEFTDQPSDRRCCWFVNEVGKVDMCARDPGFEVDLYLAATVQDMIYIWHGDLPLRRALECGRMKVLGTSRPRRALFAWLALHPLAHVRPKRDNGTRPRAHGSGTTVSSDSARLFEALAARLHGPLALPLQPEYEAARGIWNVSIDCPQAAIAHCRGAADVRDCVDYARDNHISLSVRGGGHNIAGTAICEDGLVINLSILRTILVDPTRRHARVAPGATRSRVRTHAGFGALKKGRTAFFQHPVTCPWRRRGCRSRCPPRNPVWAGGRS